jgi:hypothetical protein
LELDGEITGLSMPIIIPAPMKPQDHKRPDGLPYVDVVFGRESDSASIGVFYTGVPALMELRSIGGTLEYPDWVKNEVPSVRVYSTDFDGNWFAMNIEGEVISASREYILPAFLVEQARHWVLLNRENIREYFFADPIEAENGESCLNGLRHVQSGKTRLELAVEKFQKRYEDSAPDEDFSLNPWKDNLPGIQNKEKLASMLVDIETLGVGTPQSGETAPDFSPSLDQAMEEVLEADDPHTEAIEDLAVLAAINYGLIRGIQEGFIPDSLEALDYLIDCKGKSTSIEKAIARLSSRGAVAPGEGQAGGEEEREEEREEE